MLRRPTLCQAHTQVERRLVTAGYAEDMNCLIRHLRSFTSIGLVAALFAAPHVSAATPHPPVRLPHGRPIRLPADMAMHPDATREWWYVVGHLTDARGHTYGFETTVARVGDLKRAVPAAPYDEDFHTDVSITDNAARRFYQQMSFVGPRGVALSTRELRVRVGSAALTALGNDRYEVAGAVPGAASDVIVTPRRPALLVGGGLIPWGDGYSYYYSLTDLSASGTLTIGHRRVRVHGIAWMDHQWGRWSAISVQAPTIRDWQWMGMQLNDGTGINLAVQDTDRGPLGGAAVLLPSNRQMSFQGVQITRLGTWRSAATGTLYPSGWRVRIPRLRLDVVVRPTLRDQELVAGFPVFGYRLNYWEGDCTVTGTRAGQPVAGATYTELIGFGSPSSTRGSNAGQ